MLWPRVLEPWPQDFGLEYITGTGIPTLINTNKGAKRSPKIIFYNPSCEL